MQYVFLICLSAGSKKYVTRRSRATYFLLPARQRIKNTYCMGKRPFLFLLLIYMRFLTIFYAKTLGLSFVVDYDSERVCQWGVFLQPALKHIKNTYCMARDRFYIHRLM